MGIPILINVVPIVTVGIPDVGIRKLCAVVIGSLFSIISILNSHLGGKTVLWLCCPQSSYNPK